MTETNTKRFNNEGFIRDAVESIIATREKANVTMDRQYEWSVRVMVTPDIGYNVLVKENLFQQFQEQQIQRDAQVTMLVDHLFNVIEHQIMIEVSSVPQRGYLL